MGVVRTVRKSRIGLVAIAAVFAVAISACGASSGLAANTSAPPSDPMTGGILNAMNADRAANGLPALSWSPKLANLASNWSHQMGTVDSLYHQNLGALLGVGDFAGWRTLGENILVGPGGLTASSMETAWMGSPGHRANILSGAYNVAGAGVFYGADGRVWATVDFGGV